MEKDNIDEEKKKINLKKELIALFLVITLVLGINLILLQKNPEIEKEDIIKIVSIVNSKTVEGEKLVIKSNSEYNKIIEYTFGNNIVKTVKIYEQFEEKEGFIDKIRDYELIGDIVSIDVNTQELSIQIEKGNFGSDTGKTYEEIYDKYLVQIIGA